MKLLDSRSGLGPKGSKALLAAVTVVLGGTSIGASALSINAVQQLDRQSAGKFAGVWQMKHDGVAVITVKLTQSASGLSGSIAGNLELDDDGNLIAGDDSAGLPLDPVSDLVIDGDKLTFKLKSEDPALEFEMRLVDENKAEIRLVNLPPDAPELVRKMKPIPLARISKGA